MSQEHRMTRLGMEERNLARLTPVLALNRLPAGMIGWTKSVQIDKYGIIQVTCVSGRGQVVPHGIDADVMFALTTLFHLQGRPAGGTVEVSVAGLCQAVGLSIGEQTYKRVRESLQRLRHVSYRVVDCWAHPTKRATWSWRSLDFGILSAVEEFDAEVSEGETLGRYRPSTLLNITLSPQLLNSIAGGHIRLVDLNFYATLEQPLARILYRTLEEQRNLPEGDSKTFRVPLTAWGDHLGMRGLVKQGGTPVEMGSDDFQVPETQVLTPDKIRRALDPAHRELQEKGYFKVDYVGRGKHQRVDYTFGVPSQPVDLELVALLTQRGISTIMADKHARTYAREVIEAAVSKFDARKKSGYGIRNPGGFLSDLLENPEKYPAPDLSVGAKKVLNPQASRVAVPLTKEGPAEPPTDGEGMIRSILASLVKREKISAAEEAVVMSMHAQGRVTPMEISGLVAHPQPAELIGRWAVRFSMEQGDGHTA